jgi:hypothetical protein
MRQAAAALLLAAAVAARASEVQVPIRLDFPFVRQALVTQVFNEPGEKAAIWKDEAGCSWLDLFEPAVDGAGERLRITSRGEARIGTAVGSRCLVLLSWKGILETFAEVGLEQTVLTFRVADSHVYDEQHRKRLLTGRVWDLVKGYAHPRLASLRIDVGRPFDELRAWLPLVLPGSAEETDRLLASLVLGEPHVAAGGVAVTATFAVEPRPPGSTLPSEPVPSADELARWEAALRRWDAFHTFVAKHFARDATGDLRRAVADVLLDARHDILAALAPPTPGAPDPVPDLFVRTWERLAPVLRDIAPGLPLETALQYVSFITAADALAALTQMGPQIGLDLSADGLRRLARMIAPATGDDPLTYSLDVDPELRALFGFGPPLPPPEISDDPALDLGASLTPRAWAAVPRDAIVRLNRWTPGREDLGEYLALVRDLLVDVREAVLGRAALAAEFEPLFRHLVPATAWQESCWRQFVRRGGRLVPLTSPVGAVGIMQVNQHVWRGLYDVRGLRGDTAYNARAGAEILHHYLADHAVAKGEHRQPGGTDNLARATYAVYNGGPAHRTRYRNRNASRALRRIDEAFWEKFVAVRAGREMEVARCFGP